MTPHSRIRRHGNLKYDDSIVAVWERLIAHGATAQEIAHQFGTHAHLVRDRLKELPRRKRYLERATKAISDAPLMQQQG